MRSDTHRLLSTPTATALYMGAVLGAGALVLPGVAYREAGPASLLAWLLDAGVGIALALMFARLATAYPGARGLAGFVQEGLGRSWSRVAGWSYFIAAATGQVVVAMSGALYAGRAAGLGEGPTLVLAEAVLAVAVALNLWGLRPAGIVQIALMAVAALVLAGTAAAGLRHARPTRLEPFIPHGWQGVDHAAVTLFFAFAGWEAIASLSGLFADRAHGVARATTVALTAITTLYLALGCAVVLGLASRAASGPTALETLWRMQAGKAAVAVGAATAVCLALGTANAFVAGASRLGDRLLFAARPETAVPRLTTALIGGYAAVGVVAVVRLAGGSLAIPLLIASTLTLVAYVLCALSGLRVLPGRQRWMPLTVVLVAVLLLAAGVA